ncbi:MAG: N-acetyltransferase [Candidatus Schekmanbacteria bacterium]|nr:MAG: N-acetyltransferase [Candidatus Schekmanbacteria bacterium]
MISKNAVIYQGVVLGKNCTVEDYAVIGAIPRGKREGELKTIIGDNAVIRSHTVIYAGNKIGNNFQTGNKVNIREMNEIGNNVSIGTLSVVEHNVKIGNNVRIHTQAFIPEYTELEDGVWIGPNVVFTNALHPLCPKVKECLKGAIVKKNAIIGANSTILPDLELGEHCFVAAGSVVVKDVPAGKVVAGNPAKIIKAIDEFRCPYNLIDSPYK